MHRETRPGKAGSTANIHWQLAVSQSQETLLSIAVAFARAALSGRERSTERQEGEIGERHTYQKRGFIPAGLRVESGERHAHQKRGFIPAGLRVESGERHAHQKRGFIPAGLRVESGERHT